MVEMVERVARAICALAGVNPDGTNGGTWDGGSLPRGEPAWTAWRDEARTAIAAMREPTEAMVSAGQEEELSRTEDVKAIFSAMIDAALKD